MSRFHGLTAAVLLSAVFGASHFAAAIENPNPTPPASDAATPPTTQPVATPGTPTSTPAPDQTAAPPAAPDPATSTQKGKKKKTEVAPAATTAQNAADAFLTGYHRAHVLIYDRGDYEGGIAALRALGHDENADVATVLGYASRKLGRYDDAKIWYERALAADPDHAVTWSYYGMWQAEQGNVLKARDDLEKVRLICGTDCRAYQELKAVIDGTRTY